MPPGLTRNIAGLQVPVDDQVLVGEVDGGTDLGEELEALGDGEALLVAVEIDGPALDVLHHEVGQPLFRRASVQDARDVGVIEAGEDAPFVVESPEDFLAIHSPGNDFEGDRMAVFRIVPFGEVDGSHAAAAELPENHIGTHLGRRRRGRGVCSRKDERTR